MIIADEMHKRKMTTHHRFKTKYYGMCSKKSVLCFLSKFDPPVYYTRRIEPSVVCTIDLSNVDYIEEINHLLCSCITLME